MIRHKSTLFDTGSIYQGSVEFTVRICPVLSGLGLVRIFPVLSCTGLRSIWFQNPYRGP